MNQGLLCAGIITSIYIATVLGSLSIGLILILLALLIYTLESEPDHSKQCCASEKSPVDCKYNSNQGSQS